MGNAQGESARNRPETGQKQARNLPGAMFGSQATPMRYPSGLQWFHAHLHERTADDLMAGQARMIYVGDLRADLLAIPGFDAASALTRQTDSDAPPGFQAVQDPAGLIARCEPEAQNAGAIENVDVYHDSHEDAGMMAVLQVYDPAQTAAADQPIQFAALARGAICGLPPPPRTASLGGRVLDAAWSAARSALGPISGIVGGPAARGSGPGGR